MTPKEIEDAASNAQLTKDEAIAFHDSGIWKEWSLEQLALFQLYQTCLCVPFGKFHEATEKLLGRGVWSHEFAAPELLKKELAGELPAPDFAGIVQKLRDIRPNAPVLTIDPSEPKAIERLKRELEPS